jgi:hypothetical protein
MRAQQLTKTCMVEHLRAAPKLRSQRMQRRLYSIVTACDLPGQFQGLPLQSDLGKPQPPLAKVGFG